MTISFPVSPTDGQLYTYNNRTWQWSSTDQSWGIVGTFVNVTGPTGATGSIGLTGPASTVTGPTGPTGGGGGGGVTFAQMLQAVSLRL